MTNELHPEGSVENISLCVGYSQGNKDKLVLCLVCKARPKRLKAALIGQTACGHVWALAALLLLNLRSVLAGISPL